MEDYSIPMDLEVNFAPKPPNKKAPAIAGAF